MDNNVLLDTEEEANDMDKKELFKSLNRMSQQTIVDPKLAQVYYEKVQHLASTIYMLTKFERQLLIDLEVD